MNKYKFLSFLAIITIITSTVSCTNTKEPSDIQSSTEVKPVTENINYKSIYKEELNSLITQFGKFETPDPTYPVKGVKYAQLIKLNNDSIPELIVIHDRKLLLYNIKNEKANLLYEKTIGSRYSQSDPSYLIGLNENGNSSIIIFDSSKPWVQENINIITLDKGEVQVKNLFATTDGKNDAPIRDAFISYYIDNVETTKEEYNTVYSSTIEKCKLIDASWNSKNADKTTLDTFIDSL